MSEYRPLIGICTEPDYSINRLGTWRSYPDRILQHGGLPLMLPVGDDATDVAADIIERLDGLLLPGGGDLAPYSFGGHSYANSTNSPIDWVSPLRDQIEEELCRLAWDAHLPVLGICRGMQVMNVVHGGALIREIEELERENPIHHPNYLEPDQVIHTVDLLEGSQIASILGTAQVGVNSRHHQAVVDVAPDAHVVGWAPDGIIEAMEWPERDFFLGVQWHPESLDITQELFVAFIDAARAYAASRG